MEPLEPGKGIEFESKIVGGAVPKEYIKPIEQGMREAAESGILAGYPVTDFKVTLVDGSYHEVDSSEMAFKIAASMAFKEGMRQAKSVILEPIMKVDITVPEDKVEEHTLWNLLIMKKYQNQFLKLLYHQEQKKIKFKLKCITY